MASYQDFTYIVTGCTGYVGNVLTKKLLADGCRVIGFAKDKEKFERVYADVRPEVVYGDIRNAEDIEKLFAFDGEKAVIHTVAYVSIGEGDKNELFDVTVGGTENMLAAAKKHNVAKFLHISSTEALPHRSQWESGDYHYVPNPQKARKGYNRAKALADVAVMKAVEEGLDASILMPAGVLGPGDYSNTHMSQVMIDFINGKLPASVDGGYNDFDIRDVADVLDKIVENAKKGEAYIFANRPDKINEVLGYVAEYTGKKPLKTLPMWVAYVGLPFLYLGSVFTGKRPLYTSASLASLRANTDFPLEKVKKAFGYSPRSLKETVVDHIKFLAEIGAVEV